MLNINDFNAGSAAHSKRLAISVGLVASFFFFFLVIGTIFKDDLRCSCREQFDPAYAEAIPEILMAALLIFAGASTLGGLGLSLRHTGRDGRVVCPRCGKLLINMQALVIATRNCGHCGRRVLAEPVEKGGGEPC